MSSEKTQAILASILHSLDSNGIPLYKVVVQKFTYFLEFLGISTPFRFRPFTYGPFSFELSESLEKMTFWENIKCNDYEYHVENIDDIKLQNDDRTAIAISDSIETFKSITNENYTFNSMEVLGTTMYCMKVLSSLGEDITEEAVVRDFQGWKGSKYPESRIKDAFHKLENLSKN